MHHQIFCFYWIHFPSLIYMTFFVGGFLKKNAQYYEEYKNKSTGLHTL